MPCPNPDRRPANDRCAVRVLGSSAHQQAGSREDHQRYESLTGIRDEDPLARQTPVGEGAGAARGPGLCRCRLPRHSRSSVRPHRHGSPGVGTRRREHSGGLPAPAMPPLGPVWPPPIPWSHACEPRLTGDHSEHGATNPSEPAGGGLGKVLDQGLL